MPRAGVSKKSPYYLPDEEYWTVVHYARQYPRWCSELSYGLTGVVYEGVPGKSTPGDPTAATAAKNERLQAKIRQVEDAAREVAPEIYDWLLMGVTNRGIGYYQLQARGIPCGRRYYLKRRSAFYKALAGKM